MYLHATCSYVHNSKVWHCHTPCTCVAQVHMPTQTTLQVGMALKVGPVPLGHFHPLQCWPQLESLHAGAICTACLPRRGHCRVCELCSELSLEELSVKCLCSLCAGAAQGQKVMFGRGLPRKPDCSGFWSTILCHQWTQYICARPDIFLDERQKPTLILVCPCPIHWDKRRVGLEEAPGWAMDGSVVWT